MGIPFLDDQLEWQRKMDEDRRQWREKFENDRRERREKFERDSTRYHRNFILVAMIVGAGMFLVPFIVAYLVFRLLPWLNSLR